jgi:PAS domain S-box-containing protein
LETRVAARTAELQAHTAHLDAILSSVGDALLVTTADWRIQYVNPAFTALTGYAPGEVAGKALAVLDFVATPEFTWPASVVTAVRAGRQWRGDVVARRKDGRAYDAALIAAPIHAVDGALLGLVFSQRDIGPRKALERTRSRFITDVSHQFRTPVTALKLTAHLLHRSDDLTDWQRRQLDAMQTQLDWLTKLIENTLEITALESGDGVAATQYVLPLADAVQNLVGQFQGQAEAAGLRLTLDPIPDDLPPVTGDIYWLQKAWSKLLENALAYTPEGEQVRVALGCAVEDDRQWVTLTVADSGPGIPPEELDHIFERFYRGSLDAAGQIPGSGLGLNIAQAIVRAHGGRVTVASQVGEGSVFRLWLPAAEGSVL